MYLLNHAQDEVLCYNYSSLIGGKTLQNKLTRDIIVHDKKLREKIEFLELEKAHLDDTVLREKELITEVFSKELEKLVKTTKQDNAKALKNKEKHEKEVFEQRLSRINDIYQKEKDAWIESIFNLCIKAGDEHE